MRFWLITCYQTRADLVSKIVKLYIIIIFIIVNIIVIIIIITVIIIITIIIIIGRWRQIRTLKKQPNSECLNQPCESAQFGKSRMCSRQS